MHVYSFVCNTLLIVSLSHTHTHTLTVTVTAHVSHTTRFSRICVFCFSPISFSFPSHSPLPPLPQPRNSAATFYGYIGEAPSFQNVLGHDMSAVTCFRRVLAEPAWDGVRPEDCAPRTRVCRMLAVPFNERRAVCAAERPTFRFDAACVAAGAANCVVSWHHLHLDAELALNTLLEPAAQPGVQFFAAPLAHVDTRDTLECFAWVAADRLAFVAARRQADGPDAEPAAPAGGPVPKDIPEWAQSLPQMGIVCPSFPFSLLPQCFLLLCCYLFFFHVRVCCAGTGGI